MPVPIANADARAFTVPTVRPESDGTLEWDATTLVVAEVDGGAHHGIGYTYGHAALSRVVRETLAPRIRSEDALAPRLCYDAMVRAVRNLGSGGAIAMAISAVDMALWDLKAKILDVPLASLLGVQRSTVPAYWSGGFTSQTIARLRDEFRTARHQGFVRAKLKVGREPGEDARRVAAVRSALGPAPELYVDANGAYSIAEASALGEEFHERSHVIWLEEPVPAHDFAGLAEVRARLPPGMELASGEYGWDPDYFARLLASRAVDVVQADATRCGGVTGFLAAAQLSAAQGVPLSTHTAPSVHAHLGAAAPANFRHLEYFSDHARVEALLFDGCARAHRGSVTPDLTRPGLGIALNGNAAREYEDAS